MLDELDPAAHSFWWITDERTSARTSAGRPRIACNRQTRSSATRRDAGPSIERSCAPTSEALAASGAVRYRRRALCPRREARPENPRGRSRNGDRDSTDLEHDRSIQGRESSAGPPAKS